MSAQWKRPGPGPCLVTAAIAPTFDVRLNPFDPKDGRRDVGAVGQLGIGRRRRRLA